MSRSFNGGTAADRITFSVGAGPTTQGPITMAALVKSTSAGADQWILDADNGSFVKWGMLFSSGHTFIETDGSGGPAYTANDWLWVVVTKATGSATPRWHIKDVTTSGAWSHTNGGGNVGNVGTGATEIILGGQFTGGASTTFRGEIAVAAAWQSELSDGSVEAACTLAAADLLAASPGWMIRLNQASTATSVTDDTGGGGNQASISGTAVGASDPPGFNYSLTNNVDGDAAVTVTASRTSAASVDHNAAATVTGTATATSAATVNPGGQGAVTVTAAIASAATVTHNADIALTIAAAIATTPEPATTTTTPSGNNWGSLLAIYRQNAADVQRFLTTPLTQCPYHAYPLEPGRTPGTTHCKFGGEIFDLYGNRVLIS